MPRSDAGFIGLCLWMLHYALHRWRGLTASLGAIVTGTGLALLLPWPMKLLVDHVWQGQPMPPRLASALSFLPGGTSQEGLLTWCIAGSIVLFVANWTTGLVAAFANIAFGQQMFYDLASDLYAHLQSLSLRFHGRNAVGDSIRRVTSDCHCISTIARDAMLPSLSAVFSLGAMFLLMLRMDPQMTLLSAVVLPFLVVVLRRYARPMSDLGYAKQEVEARLYDLTEQSLSAIPVVQAFTAEERLDRQFKDLARQTLMATDAMTRAELKFKVFTGAVVAAGTAGILWVGANHVLEGRLTVGTILVFVSYLSSLYGPLEVLMYSSTTLQAATGSARRVIEVLATQQEVEDRAGAPPLSTGDGHIRLENVTFGYEPGRPVLRGLNLEVLPGQTVAIVGATGAGKSTLVGLVPRFFDPWEGRVTIDGQDVREVQFKSLRSNIALVLQEPFLFPLTIAQNIAYGRPDASREQVVAAAQAANAHAFIECLPNGYDTLVGERGATLSGGERQRLSIARALLIDAPILILDEPTSSLDAQTESLLLEALERLQRERTTLIIAHRLSTVRNADRIAVVEQGHIAEFGTHRELLDLGGLYRDLHDFRFGRASTAAGISEPDVGST